MTLCNSYRVWHVLPPASPGLDEDAICKRTKLGHRTVQITLGHLKRYHKAVPEGVYGSLLWHKAKGSVVEAMAKRPKVVRTKPVSEWANQGPKWSSEAAIDLERAWK